MRILNIVESLSFSTGGLSRLTANLAEALARQGYETEIFTTHESDENAYLPVGVKIQSMQRGPFNKWAYSPGMAPAIRQAVRQADVVHLHGLWLYPHLIASRSAWRAQKPYIVSPQGMLDTWALEQGKLRKSLYAMVIEKPTLKRANAIHVLNDAEANSIKRFGLTTRVVTIPNGVELREFENFPDRNVFARKYPAIEGQIVLLFFSRVHPKKGLDLLVNAFCKILKERTDVVLVIAGPCAPEYQHQLEAYLREGGAQGRYIFTGLLQGEACFAALAAADIFILPSYSEGFPLAALEAMAASLPVILSKECNIQGIEKYEAGLITDLAPDSLYNSILRLILNPIDRKRMGNNGRHLVQNLYSCDIIASRMTELYKSFV